MMKLSVPALLVLVSATAISAQQLPVLHSDAAIWEGSLAQSQVPNAAVTVGDVDKDGTDDLALVHRYAAPNGLRHAGSIRIVSGADGSVLASRAGDRADDLPAAVVAIGDVNFDTVPDLAVGEPGSGVGPGRVRVLSGLDLSDIIAPLTGRPLQGSGAGLATVRSTIPGLGDFLEVFSLSSTVNGVTYTLEAIDTASGTRRIITQDANLLRAWTSFRCAGDLNGDGIGDVILSNANGSGSVRALSGVDGAILWTRFGSSRSARLGTAIEVLDDRDSDGKSDLAIGAPFDSSSTGIGFAGRVLIVSGADGDVIGTIDGTLRLGGLGSTLAKVSDLDGDGAEDLMVGGTRGGSTASIYLAIHSTATGNLISKVQDYTDSAPLKSLQGLVATGDVTGDAHREVVALGDLSNPTGKSLAAHWLMPTGAREFGHKAGQVSILNPLRLEVLRYDETSDDVQLVVFNGTPGGAGLFGFSLAAVDVPLSTFGGSFLVEWNVPSFTVAPFSFQPSGWVAPRLSMSVPALADQVVYMQALDTSDPSGLRFTSRVEMRFHR